VPLRPLVVDVRWRPLRAPRIRLRGLMLGVGVMAVVFSLCAYLGRVNRAIAYHHKQARKAALNRIPFRSLAPQTATPEDMNWHAAMASEYQDTFMRLDLIVFKNRRVGRASIYRGEAHRTGSGDRWASRCKASFDPPYEPTLRRQYVLIAFARPSCSSPCCPSRGQR
jgi:hypothetical protein